MNNEPNISLYDAEGGVEDFPVLKAFQQYIDAEQAKSRRRLITLSAFFAVVLVAVIGIFSFLVISANERSQALNDRLIEFAMKEADRKVNDAKASAMQEASVKSMTDALQRMQQQLDAQSKASVIESAAVVPALPVKDHQTEKRQAETEAKLQKALALLKAEKEKLNNEKERLRQEELERYRRQNYPEYYAKKEGKKVSPNVLTYDDVEDEEDEEEAVVEVKPVKKSAPKKAVKPKVEKEVDLDEDEGIEYFNEEEDNLKIPVEVKGKRAGWRVPLD